MTPSELRRHLNRDTIASIPNFPLGSMTQFGCHSGSAIDHRDEIEYPVWILYRKVPSLGLPYIVAVIRKDTIKSIQSHTIVKQGGFLTEVGSQIRKQERTVYQIEKRRQTREDAEHTAFLEQESVRLNREAYYGDNVTMRGYRDNIDYSNA